VSELAEIRFSDHIFGRVGLKPHSRRVERHGPRIAAHGGTRRNRSAPQGGRAVSDADERWLHCGAVATPIDRPKRTFGYVEDAENPRFGAFPTAFIERTDASRDEDRGRILLSELDRDLYERFGNSFDRVDVRVFAADLIEETLFRPHEARIVVLYGWFDMDREAAAEALETEPESVASLVAAIRERRQQADRTAAVRFTPE
jgi:hypothetical protein